MSIIARNTERIECNISANICTTINSRPGRIVDVSEHGAQIRMEEPYHEGDKIHVDVEGHYTWAIVKWTEVDRLGVKFTTPMTDGSPIHAVIADHRRRRNLTSNQTRTTPIFGRRAA